MVDAHGECSQSLLDFLKIVADQGALARFRIMGFKSPLEARSTVLNQIYMAIGVETIRGIARVRVANHSLALAGSSAKTAFEEQNLAH